MTMARSSRRLLTFISWLLATAGLIVAACFVANCLIDPLWYLRGNVLTEINYPFNERLSKIVRFLPRLQDYDCIILGTSRATLLPEDKTPGYRCFNLAVSDGQASEYLLYADYLRKRGFAPKLLIVEVRRADLIGPIAPPILASYLSLDALNFSVRTLRRDAPHHRYYDQNFGAHLEVRSKKRYYNPPASIKPMPPPVDVHPERAELYVQLRQKFPMARAVGYVPLESAWRVAAFGLTGGFDAYLGAIGRIAAAYDQFLDFSIPSAMTQSKDPADTYDGVHYSRAVNARVLAALLGNNSDLAIDWRRADAPTVIADYRDRLAQFVATAAQAAANAKTAKESRKSEGPERD